MVEILVAKALPATYIARSPNKSENPLKNPYSQMFLKDCYVFCAP